MITSQLNSNEYNSYYESYINLSPSKIILEGLEHSKKTTVEFYLSLPTEKHEYAYAEGKWTIKDILLHIIDTERIFAYRALRIARQDMTPLVGFEQDDYVLFGKANSRSLKDLLDEYITVREATISLFKSLTEVQLKQIGVASNSPISPRAIGYIISGHEIHHNNLIKERYL